MQKKENIDIYFAILVLEKELSERKKVLEIGHLLELQAKGLKVDIKQLESSIQKIRKQWSFDE